MRIISMVPSWTETLLEAGADVVGRTRFCVHPKGRVRSIPAVGGTKDWDLDKVRALKPDLVILDREENTKAMGSVTGLPIFSSHVRSVNDMPGELRKLAEATGLPKLDEYRRRFESVLKRPIQRRSILELPAIEDWIVPISPDQEIDQVIYMIWRNPWMAVSRETFIGSMLSRFINPEFLLENDKPYPQISFENLNEESTLLLFSTEPFPFKKQTAELQKLRFASCLVDGEKWSWFGLRSLRFLESFSKI